MAVIQPSTSKIFVQNYYALECLFKIVRIKEVGKMRKLISVTDNWP